MKDNIQDTIILAIKNVLVDLRHGEIPSEDLYLDFPADSRFGDLSTNIALRLSKVMGRPGRELAAIIAEGIKKGLSAGKIKDYIKDVKVEGGGFVNFYLSERYFYNQLQAIIRNKDKALKQNLGASKSVLIEFVSANPTGPLSLAHARQAAVGDSLARIMDFTGFKVNKEYYLNDEGNQIDILGKSVELRLQELDGQKMEFPENYYQGEYIRDIAVKAKNSKPNGLSLSDYAAGYILGIIKKELDDFGVYFDRWYSQKELAKSAKIKKALDLLKKKGFIYQQEGALWFRSSQLKDDKDRVVIKSDGSYTYLAPDIAYHLDKYRRGFKWLINLWGPDHHGYIARLKAAVEALGYNSQSLDVVIVQLATIFKEGKSIEMSTRRGQYITLREVLDEVGKDASRFFFLMRRTSSHLDFDLDIAKKHTSENPVYYVQYAHARIKSILRQGNSWVRKADLCLLKEAEEIDLIKKLWQFGTVLRICVNTLDPYMLTVYLQEAAEVFHKFYDKHRVLGNNRELTKARLALIQATSVVLAQGLELLGVSAPDEM
jgi:arginyl-tRNA synthetase